MSDQKLPEKPFSILNLGSSLRSGKSMRAQYSLFTQWAKAVNPNVIIKHQPSDEIVYLNSLVNDLADAFSDGRMNDLGRFILEHKGRNGCWNIIQDEFGRSGEQNE